MNFYVGQRVVYITGIAMPKGSIHTINQIFAFPCGCFTLDIGKRVDFYGLLTCCDHNCSLDTRSNVHHFASESFAPLSERTAESESFAENLITQLETEVETLEWLHK